MKRKHSGCGCDEVAGHDIESPCPICHDWARGFSEVDNFDMTMQRWQLEPLKRSGETLDLCHYANVWRVFFLQKLEQTTKAKDPLRRRIIKLLRAQKYLELQFWLAEIDMDNFVYYALTDFLSNDKALWLRATKPDTDFWERYHGIITEAYDNHGFTRKELIPLLQHPDPEMKMLGLKLMRSTLNDAEKASMRVRGG